ncbi:AAA family ATPase [Candidatus Saccharibacteria bacterium]|nr:MAG: AAA family ATPase [Candidatus Saccharibacteria bacterium]
MRGLVIGKFYPPHLGHNFLINTALKDCNDVDVLVVDNPAYNIAAELRRAWLQAHHPSAHVMIIPDINNDDDSVAWAAHTMQFLGYKPDVVYSSEDYGGPWAHYMGARSVVVDKARETVPISGTKVRANLLESWQYLSDEVRAGLCLRIVVVGAESTGTTTLARDLAEALHVPWVPEIGRYYTESILTCGADWQNDDFYRIGRLQQAYEREIAARSKGVIVCDTNAVATQLWQRRYLGKTTSIMRQIAARDKADLYIITGDEIPFVQDGIRDGEHIRHEMHRWFTTYIAKLRVPCLVVRGSHSERLAKSLTAAKKMIKQGQIIH